MGERSRPTGVTDAVSVFLDVDPTDWVASNDLAFAIRDRYPVNPGHTLIVPRRVVGDWWDASPNEHLAILELVTIVKRRLDAEFSPDGYNVGFNAGRAAGQTVDHLHLHVIPRFDGDLPDPRGGVRHVIPSRGNCLTGSIAHLPPVATSLITPSDGRLQTELRRCLASEEFDRIDLLVSFVKRSGIDLIARQLDDAIERGAHVRVLTTDYLFITDAAALGFFLDRVTDAAAGRLDVRVFSDTNTSFHPKAYLFSSSTSSDATAFIGSSNLTYSGIAAGIEWNLQTSATRQLIAEFDGLWNDERSRPLTAAWLEHYGEAQQDRQGQPDRVFRVETDVEVVDLLDVDDQPRPRGVQNEALHALEATRIDGHQAGLVVMATGLGKTWLAAFDSTRPEFRRVLFVAHREEILSQARDVYRRIRPTDRLTMFTGDEREPDGDVVFASIQSLTRNLGSFPPESFDYVVVDEFHHAAAPTYRRAIAHFRPRFLLGLTATPNRADNAPLLALCADNLVFECELVEGIRRELLSPFRYRAIPDVADYAHIPWRKGRFDPEELTAQLATRRRAAQVHDEWIASGGVERRALGFCSTIRHADFMAEYFRERGVNAVAVHSGPTSAPRGASLDLLASGEVDIIFTVDIFNEGVDVPEIDLVMMLRPTESSVVFLQQLGRGLRRAAGKDALAVVDLVGNHRGFLLKARLLATLAGFPNATDREAVGFLSAADHPVETVLPEGCSIVVDPEVVDFLQQLLGPANKVDQLVEVIRQWIDEHDGERPTASAIAVLTGQPFTLKARGGWFGLLDEIGVLTASERDVVAQLREFFVWIEHGSYTKSFKLITLQALLHLDAVRAGASVTEVAALSRWLIFRDAELLADLSDTASAFADPNQPTVDEWNRYWRRNPIAALTNAPRGGTAWFSIDESDRLTLAADIGDELGETFDAMVAEIVEYRLHRYLLSQSARRIGESRRPRRDGVAIDATFTVETTGAIASSVVIESAGGTRGSTSARNVEYVDGFDLVLARLADVDAILADAYVDTSRTADLSVADRRLDPGSGSHYPLRLADVTDLVELRRSLLRSMSQVGRQPGVKGGGNSRKRARLVIETPRRPFAAAELADVLATGELPAVAGAPEFGSDTTAG